MTATFVLTGMRVGRDILAELFRGVKVMLESSAFDLFEEKGRQEGLVAGRVEECHRLLLRQGTQRFGAPDSATEIAVRAVRDLDRLERLADVVLTTGSRQALLAAP